MSNNEYKSYPIETIEDGLYVMQVLLAHVKRNLILYSRYADEINQLSMKILEGIQKRLGNEQSLESFVDGIDAIYDRRVDIRKDPKYYHDLILEYENPYKTANSVDGDLVIDIRDKILYRQGELFKFIADESKLSFSYKNVRKKLVEKNYLCELTPEIGRILTKLADRRNVNAHFAQAQLVAVREELEKKHPQKDYKRIFSSVPCHVPDSFSPQLLREYALHAKFSLGQFQKVYDSMQEDYQALYSHYVMANEAQSDQVDGDRALKPTDIEYRVDRQHCQRSSFGPNDSGFDNIITFLKIQRNRYHKSKP